MSTSLPHTPVELHRYALTAAATDPQNGPVVLTVLTTLLRPHELVEPTTRVQQGRLHVASPTLDPTSTLDREIPLAAAADRLELIMQAVVENDEQKNSLAPPVRYWDKNADYLGAKLKNRKKISRS